MPEIKLEEIPLDSLECHPKIVFFYHETMINERDKKYGFLSDTALQSAQKAAPINVIKSYDKHYFFAGWELISELKKRKFKKVFAIIHLDLGDDKILDFVVATQAIKMVTSSLIDKEIKSVEKLLNSNFDKRRELFQSKNPKTGLSALMILLGKTRSQMRTLLSNKKEKSELSSWLEGK